MVLLVVVVAVGRGVGGLSVVLMSHRCLLSLPQSASPPASQEQDDA